MKTRTTTPSTLSARDQHLLPYATAIVAYAKQDEAFAQALIISVAEKQFAVTTSATTQLRTAITITEQETAITTAHWLLSECDRTTPYTIAYLQEFSKLYESPKSPLFGIVGLAIIGPTLGLIKRSKRQKSHLQVLVDASYAKKLNKEKFSSLTSTEGQLVLAKELKLAGGTVPRLHPDTAEWLMSDPATTIKIVEQNTLRELATIVEAEKLSGHVKRDDSTIQLIAVSPAVPDAVADDIL